MRSKFVFLYVDTQFNVSKCNFNMKNSNSKCWLGFGRFFWGSQKQMKIQLTFKTIIFQNISALWFIKLNICISKTKFTSRTWYRFGKKHFPQCVYYWQNLLRSMFFIPCDNWKILYFIQTFVILRYSSTAMFLPSFETNVLKDVRILCSFSPYQHCKSNTKNPEQSCSILYLFSFLN